MRIALTGTPGTGKSTVAALLPYRVIDINALVRDGLYLGVDRERGCLEADMDALERRLEELERERELGRERELDREPDRRKGLDQKGEPDRGEGLDRKEEPDRETGLDQRRELGRQRELDDEEICILEGHFAHRFADWAIVLRASPEVLRRRLLERGYSAKKIRENLEAEALDIVLAEAVECCRRVDEIDTTRLTAREVSELVEKIIRGELRLPPGQVDWLEEFFGSC